jgi:hypothetical protein
VVGTCVENFPHLIGFLPFASQHMQLAATLCPVLDITWQHPFMKGVLQPQPLHQHPPFEGHQSLQHVLMVDVGLEDGT